MAFAAEGSLLSRWPPHSRRSNDTPVLARFIVAVPLLIASVASASDQRYLDFCKEQGNCRVTTPKERIELLTLLRKLEETVEIPRSYQVAMRLTAEDHLRTSQDPESQNATKMCHSYRGGCFPESVSSSRIVIELDENSEGAAPTVLGTSSVAITIYGDEPNLCLAQTGQILLQEKQRLVTPFGGRPPLGAHARRRQGHL